MNIRFGIDLDGVLANFGTNVIEVVNSIWPDRLPLDYVPQDWDYSDVFTKEDWATVWAGIKRTEDFWYREDAIQEGISALDKFLLYTPHKIDVYFITSRARTMGDTVLAQSSRWLAKFGLWPRNGHSTVIPVEDAKHKEAICAGLKLPFMLDDYAPTVQKLQTVEGLQAYVLDQPWNRYAEHLPRVYSVAEYLEIVNKG